MTKLNLFKFSSETVPERQHQEWFAPNKLVLALICYVCGPATTAKFPQLVHKYGNFNVVVPYVLSICLLAVPLIFVEMTLGQYTGTGLPVAWRMAPVWQGAGWASLFVLLNLAVYQNYATAQALLYMVRSGGWTLPWDHCDPRWSRDNCFNITAEHTYKDDCMFGKPSNCSTVNWQNSVEHYYEVVVLKTTTSESLSQVNWVLFMYSGLLLLLVFICLSKLLQSLERIVDILTLIPFLLLVVLLTTSLLCHGTLHGLCKFLTPNFTGLKNPRLWMEVIDLNLYSMGLGLGGIIAISAHSNFRTNIFKISTFVPLYGLLTDLLFTLFVYTSFAGFGMWKKIDVDDLFLYDKSLVFVKMPMVFLKWPCAPKLRTLVFFVYFFMLGFRCLLLMVFTLVKAMYECFDVTNVYPKSSVGAVCFVIYLLDSFYFTHMGIALYRQIEFLSSTLLFSLVVFMQITGVFYIYGSNNLATDVHFMQNIRVRCLKYYWMVIPIMFVPVIIYNFHVWICHVLKSNRFIFFVEVFLTSVPIGLWALQLVRHWFVHRGKSFRVIFGADGDWGSRNPAVRKNRDLFKSEEVGHAFTYRQQLYSEKSP